MFKLFFGGIAAVALFIGGLLGQHQTPQTTPDFTPTFGAFAPTGGSTYRLGQSIGTTDTTIKLSSFKEPVSNTPYTMTYINTDILYATLSPQSSVSEFISFTGITQNTDGSATLSGVKRGLSRTPANIGCVASTTLAQPHAGQSILILSNSPCFYAEYTPLRTNATSSAILTFSSTSPPRLDSPGAQASGTYISTTSEFATYALVAAVANAGTVNATESVKGIGQLATQVQMASSTVAGSTGASLFLYSKYATSSPFQSTGIFVPITQNDGKLNPNFIATSSLYNYSWGGQHSFVAATSTSFGITNYLNWNGLGYTINGSRQASSSVLSENGSGGLSWIVPKATTLSVASPNTSSSGATSTLQSVTLPANTLSSSKTLRVTAQFINRGGGNCTYDVQVGTGLSSTTAIAGRNTMVWVSGVIMSTTTNSLATAFTNIGTQGGSGVDNPEAAATPIFAQRNPGYSTTGNLFIAFRASSDSAACALIGETVEQVAN